MTRGRPKLPEGEALQHVSLRLPKWLIDQYDDEGEDRGRSTLMRLVLERYMRKDT
jgi:hypothetical protein